MFGTQDTELAGMLKQHDILPTTQRMQIARTLFERPRHLSAEQVLSEVNVGEAHVSKATVYNTLGLFAQHGLINEVIVDPARVFYDPNTTHHHHFYNVDTGELTDIDAGDLDIGTLPDLPDGTISDGVDIIIRVRSIPQGH